MFFVCLYAWILIFSSEQVCTADSLQRRTGTTDAQPVLYHPASVPGITHARGCGIGVSQNSSLLDYSESGWEG